MIQLLRLSLAIAALGTVGACSMFNRPADLDVRLTRPSDHALYMVSMRPMLETPPINQIHAWEIDVTTSAGVPVTDAQIAFDGGMPQHGHGLPTQPRVTGSLGEGRYRLDGMKFSMSGWWELKVKVHAAQGDDQIVFNTVIGEPAAGHAQTATR